MSSSLIQYRALAFAVLLTALPQLAGAEPPLSLFLSPASATQEKSAAVSPEAKLTRLGKMPIRLNDGLFGLRKGDQVDLETPAGEIFSVTFDRSIEHSGNGGRSWLGHLSNFGRAYRVVLTATGSVVTGRITLPDRVLRIVYENGGAFLQDDNRYGMQAFPLLEDDSRIAPPELRDPPSAATLATGKAISTIDVLVLYNQAFANRYPGAQLQNRLNSLFSIANTAYADSQVEITARLVGTQLINFSNGINNDAALDAITDNTVAGVNIHALRNSVGADLVVLMRPFNRLGHVSCGVAWLNDATPSASLGYSIVSDGDDEGGSNFFCDDFTFAHEMGHNEGSTHDRANSSNPPAFPYSYGYGFDGSFGTIMSYINPIIGRFSNPNIQCNGSPCGVAQGNVLPANNALSLNNLKAQVAAFRNATTVTPVTLSIQKTGNGTVTSNTGINCGATCSQSLNPGTVVNLSASAAAGSEFGSWTNCPAPSGASCALTLNSNRTVTANFTTVQGSLAQALDNNTLNISTSGNANWFVQNQVVSVGATAAQSGTIGHNQSSHLDITVSGPATLSFFWRASSQTNADFLIFYIDGVEQARISGTTGWLAHNATIATGQHNLRWRYTKNGSIDSGSDAGWLDNVMLTPIAPPPPPPPPSPPPPMPPSDPEVGPDFGGDGKADILLRDSSNGDLSMFQMDNHLRTLLPIGPLGQNWRVIGVADLGGDGQADIVLRRNDGFLAMYEMDNNARIFREIGELALNFEVVGIADVGGDGKADLILRNLNSGQLFMFEMDNHRFTARFIGNLSLAWSVVGVKDLGGDNRADIVIRNNTTGQMYLFEMDNNVPTGHNIGGLNQGWRIAAIGDTGGDKRADLILRNLSTGQIYVFRMDNNRITGGVNLRRLPLQWTVVGAADFNGDGRDDLLLRNNNTGQLYLYQLNDTTRIGFNIGALSTQIDVVSPSDNRE